MISKKIVFIIILASYLSTLQIASCSLPYNEARVWDNVLTDILVDISILSKISATESVFDLVNQQLSGIDGFTNELGTITSYLEDIDARTETVISKINALTTFANSTINSELDLIENSHQSIASVVHVIDTRTNSIYTINQTTSSLIDVDTTLEDAILSKLMIIDSKANSIAASCSGIDQIIANEETILSTVQVIDTRTGSIYNLDQTTLSYVQDINAHTLTIESLINTIDQSVHTTVHSKLELIENNNLSIQSVVNQIDTKTSSIYSIDQIISSQIDQNILLDQQTESLVIAIDSKLEAISCSQLAQILATDRTILSKVNVIDTRTTNIQSNLNNIYSIDQNIASQVDNLFTLDTSISSKLDLNIAIDRTVESLANLIDAQVHTDNSLCSAIAQIIPIDQSILSTLNVIDTRTTNIQSNLNNIYNLSQTISSKLDTDAPLQSSVNVLSTTMNTIQSYGAIIIPVDATIASKVATLSLCCTNTTSISTSTTSLFGSQVMENTLDNISIQFQYGIPDSTTTSYTQGGGTVTSSNSMAVLSTAASTSSIAQLQTDNTILYRSGHEAYALFTVAFTGSFTATSSQFIGPIDYQNGFAIGFDGTTFGVTRRSDTVNTFTPQSQFNGDKLDGTGTSGFLYNPALLNVFRIAYGYLGATIIQFQIMNSTGGFITFHTIQYPNSSAAPSIQQPFLPITARVENLTGTSVLTLQTASWNGGIVGQPNNNAYKYFCASSYSSGMLVIRNKTVFNNRPNKIRVRCTAVGATIRSTPDSSLTYSLIKNGTITGTSFSDVSSGNSVVEVSTAGTYSAGTGTEVYKTVTYVTANVGILPIPLDAYVITILPGETLAVTGLNTTEFIAINWEEQF